MFDDGLPGSDGVIGDEVVSAAHHTLDMCLFKGEHDHTGAGAIWHGMPGDVLSNDEALADLFQSDHALATVPDPEYGAIKLDKQPRSSSFDPTGYYFERFDSPSRRAQFAFSTTPLEPSSPLCWQPKSGPFQVSQDFTTGPGGSLQSVIASLDSAGRPSIRPVSQGSLSEYNTNAPNSTTTGRRPAARKGFAKLDRSRSKRRHPPPRRMPRGSNLKKRQQKSGRSVASRRTSDNAENRAPGDASYSEGSDSDSGDSGDALLRQSANERERQRVRSINAQMEMLRSFLLEPPNGLNQQSCFPPNLQYPVPFPPPPTEVCRENSYHGCCIRPPPVNNAGKVAPRKRGRRISKVDMLRAVKYHFQDLCKNLSIVTFQLTELQNYTAEQNMGAYPSPPPPPTFASSACLDEEVKPRKPQSVHNSITDLWQPWTTKTANSQKDVKPTAEELQQEARQPISSAFSFPGTNSLSKIPPSRHHPYVADTVQHRKGNQLPAHTGLHTQAAALHYPAWYYDNYAGDVASSVGLSEEKHDTTCMYNTTFCVIGSFRYIGLGKMRH